MQSISTIPKWLWSCALLSYWTFVLIPAQAQIGDAVVPSKIEAQPKFKVLYYKATISSGSTVVLECFPNALRYVSPYFTVNATIQCSIPAGQSWTIGYIQLADFMQERIEYKRAWIDWENPSSPNLDSSGSEIPWYDNYPQNRQSLPGGTSNQQVGLSYFDNFDGYVGWHEPLPPDDSKEGINIELNHVMRDQQCSSWLVARRDSDGKIVVLKKATWRIKIDIAVNPDEPLGSRCQVNAVPIYQPVLEDGEQTNSSASISLLTQCLNQSPAGRAQQLWWNPIVKGIGTRTRLK